MVAPPGELVRLVAPDACVIVSSSASPRGRGAWIHPRLACVQAAVRGSAFGRAFKCAVKAPAEGELYQATLAVIAGRG